MNEILTPKQRRDLFWATLLVFVVGFAGGLAFAWLMTVV